MSDILLLSLGTTIGLRTGDQTLAELLREAGASVQIAGVRIGAAKTLRRAYPLTDLIEAAAARRALLEALGKAEPRAVIFSSTTSSLLAGEPRLPGGRGLPYAVRLDAPSSLNRPGARNALQHALERRRLSRARLVLPFSRAAAEALPPGAAPAVVLPQPLARSGGHRRPRERLAVAYTPDPKAKGLDIAIAAWTRAKLTDARLEVFGITADRALAHLNRHGLAAPPGVRWRGRVAAEEFRATLRRAQAFLTGARWEDFGFAQLEALADGALLVCGATCGPFEALAHARALAPELCAPDLSPDALARALRRAFEMPEGQAQHYRHAATQRLVPYQAEEIRALISERVLPALLG